MNMVIY